MVLPEYFLNQLHMEYVCLFLGWIHLDFLVIVKILCCTCLPYLFMAKC